MHGGAALDALTMEDVAAVERGLENLAAHLDAASQFKRPIVVAINQFTNDSVEEIAVVKAFCAARGVKCALANVFGEGGPGATELAQLVVEAASAESSILPMLYDNAQPVTEKLHAVATRIYGATGVRLTDEAQAKLATLDRAGFSKLPLCMAKTQDSLSDDKTRRGRPTNFEITVRDFEIANGAGFLVALTGTMMRMPALPKIPAAERVDVDTLGHIVGV
jgi:formate--tetrahydrofolate ligase